MMTPRPDRFTYPEGKARGAEIEVTHNWTRAVFVGGLVGCFALALAALAVTAV